MTSSTNPELEEKFANFSGEPFENSLNNAEKVNYSKFSEEITAVDAQEFIFKIARAPNLKRADAIEGIVTQLNGLEQNRYFPHVFDVIDPDNLYPETNDLDEEQRELMRVAINAYIIRAATSQIKFGG